MIGQIFIHIAVWILVATPSLVHPLLTFASSTQRTIVVGSKNFMENRLLAEIFAQLIESRTGVIVERRLGLAGTQVCFEALKTGAIDLYPEYTGTGLVTILGQEASKSSRETLNRVRAEFLARWNLWWISPLGFENSYALALPRKRAQTLKLRTISDLSKVSSSMKAGLGYEFVQRADGYPGLQQQYGLQFKEIATMQQSLKYQATDSGDVDVLDVYTTDGRLAIYDFVVLEDDLHFFPPYEAAVLARGETLEQIPELGTTLTLLTNALDAELMRKLNLRIQEQGDLIEHVAHDALTILGLTDQLRVGVNLLSNRQPGKLHLAKSIIPPSQNWRTCRPRRRGVVLWYPISRSHGIVVGTETSFGRTGDPTHRHVPNNSLHCAPGFHDSVVRGRRPARHRGSVDLLDFPHCSKHILWASRRCSHGC